MINSSIVFFLELFLSIVQCAIFDLTTITSTVQFFVSNMMMKMDKLRHSRKRDTAQRVSEKSKYKAMQSGQSQPKKNLSFFVIVGILCRDDTYRNGVFILFQPLYTVVTCQMMRALIMAGLVPLYYYYTEW